MMKPGDLLFVYGTLRSGQGADLTIRSGAKFVQDDTIRGELFNLGWYPGVKLNGDGLVHGEVFELMDEPLIRHLDNYEGYPLLYDRVQVDTLGGLHVWVYTINRECGSNEKIASGDWLHQEEAA